MSARINVLQKQIRVTQFEIECINRMEQAVWDLMELAIAEDNDQESLVEGGLEAFGMIQSALNVVFEEYDIEQE